MAHTHKCNRCGTLAPCHGTQERNHDGFPPVICLSYHATPVSYLEFECEDCSLVSESTTPDGRPLGWCASCGEHPALDNPDRYCAKCEAEAVAVALADDPTPWSPPEPMGADAYQDAATAARKASR